MEVMGGRRKEREKKGEGKERRERRKEREKKGEREERRGRREEREKKGGEEERRGRREERERKGEGRRKEWVAKNKIVFILVRLQGRDVIGDCEMFVEVRSKVGGRGKLKQQEGVESRLGAHLDVKFTLHVRL